MIPYIPPEVLFRHIPLETDMIINTILVCKSWKKEIDAIKENVIFIDFYKKYPFLKNENYMASPMFFDLNRGSFLSFLYLFKKHVDEDKTDEEIFKDLLNRILPKKPTNDLTKAYHTISILISLYEYSFEQTTGNSYKCYSSWICYLLYSYIIRLFIYHDNPICLNTNFIESNRTNIELILSHPCVCPSLVKRLPRLLHHGLCVIHL